jgi:hypothetical protein
MSAEKRRWSAWTVAFVGAIVFIIAAISVAIWPKPTNNDPTATASTKQDRINAQPSGSGTFNDDPASGSVKPPEAIDRSPSPSGTGSSGPTQVITPSGTEKMR